MSFRFSLNGQVYDIVHASQSGQLIHQQRISITSNREIELLVDDLLAQNAHQVAELRQFLCLTGQGSPRETLREQLYKGNLVIQKGSLSHIGGPARAPQGSSRRPNAGAKSKLYSNTMLRSLSDLETGEDNHHPRKVQRDLSQKTVNNGRPSSITANRQAQDNFKICVEIAGRARCFKQRLEVSKINQGQAASERLQLGHASIDHEKTHRCLVEFNNLSSTPRDVALVISTSGTGSPIRLPLVEGHPTYDQKTEKEEWDTVLIPVKPLAYVDKSRDRQKADLLQPGFVYVFWKGKLWRELQVNKNHSLRDINVEFYRNNWNGDLGQLGIREADGHWLSEIWLPYKLNGTDQSDQLYLLYSQTQLDFSYIETLENDTAKLEAKGTGLKPLAQYSQQHKFTSDSGDIGPVNSALLDQAIPPELGYEILSEKGHHLTRLREQNIPVAYLVPVGEKFILQLKNRQNQPLVNWPFKLECDKKTVEGTTDQNGILEVALEDPISAGEIKIWKPASSGTPDYTVPFKVESLQLPDVSTVKGQQLRLNNLAFNAGIVDGIMGRKTRAAARAFQQAYGLEVDGIIGQRTQKKLKQIYQQ